MNWLFKKEGLDKVLKEVTENKIQHIAENLQRRGKVYESAEMENGCEVINSNNEVFIVFHNDRTTLLGAFELTKEV